jgi:signal transduction histidine kinase
VIAAALGGWVAAGAAGAIAAAARRTLSVRMESVARACHELRGPLTAARLGLQLGADGGDLSAARLRAIDLELGQAALALEDLGTPGAPRIGWRAPEPVDLRELVSDSVEAWRPAAEARGVELRASWAGSVPPVWGERLRLAQAVGNLIANALEHGGGAVEVRGRAVGAGVRIEVTDTGPGLPAPVAELVRAARGGRGRRGRGLAIATAIAQSHGGRVAVAPSERGGRVVLTLPGGIPCARPRPASAGDSAGGAKLHRRG